MRHSALGALVILTSACSSILGQPAGEPVSVPEPTAVAITEPTTRAGEPSPTTTSPTTTEATTAPAPLEVLRYEEVVSGIPFPVGIEFLPNDPSLYVVSKNGQVWIWRDGIVLGRPFLDISALVRDQGERGFLGLAFHPDYASNGRLFVHHSDTEGNTRVAEYRVSADPDAADPDSAREILSVSQPAGNHNGGQLSFGPDGYLYLGLGDGGGANDRFGNGQRADTLLATILRLDVDSAEPYAIPPDNPFVGGGGAPEVWAYGLRNPWRFTFDEGLLYIGDVGQVSFEEIDVAPSDAAGLNYGWPITEGLHCFRPTTGCDTTGLTLPVVEVSHDDAGSCSITGGVVYRGAEIPELVGHYFYSDWCGGWLRSFRVVEGEIADETDWTGQTGLAGRVTSFGHDAFGEVYLAVSDRRILKLVAER